MKKLIFLSSMFLLVATGVSANFGSDLSDAEKVKQIRTRKLIVITEVPNEKVLKDIAKPNEPATLETYKSTLVTYNEKMKAVVEKFWPYASNGIEYKTWAEAEQLKKNKNKDYAVMYCLLRSQLIGASFTNVWRDNGMNEKAHLFETDKRKDYEMYNAQLEVCLSEDFFGSSAVAVRVPDILPTETSLIWGLKILDMFLTIQANMNKKEPAVIEWFESRKNCRKLDITKLAGKTLMVRKDLLDKDVTEAMFKEYYPYKFKMCTKEELDDMCMNNKVPANTAVLLTFPVDDAAYEPKAVHANIYVYDLNTSMGLTLVAENFRRLNEKSLKRFTKK